MTVWWANPTLEAIAAQCAMIERSEAKRKAARQAEERDRLRDTFAAAALTGLLADDGDRVAAMGEFTARAYAWADAMLRARDADATHVDDTTLSEGSVHGEDTK